MPKGWRVSTIEELAERVAMGPFGSSIKVSTFVSHGVPVISGQHLHDTMLHDEAYNFISFEHAKKLKNANVFRGDVIFTHAGHIEQVAYIPSNSQYDRYVLSQRQFYMRCNPSNVTLSFIVYYFKSTEGQYKLLANTSTTGVPSISRPVTYLRSIQIPVPPKVVMDEFEKFVQPMHLQIRSNIIQSNTLATMRDALLPKLLSGEIRVKDAERFVEAST
ncbi:MAG: restriction endonuclease subunit S [Nitrospirae bacterium]|nr:restriction endonuclease subunit S [Nitrospirota bacterium]